MPIKNSPEKARKTPKTQREKDKIVASMIEARLSRFIRADAFAEPAPVEDGKKSPRSHLMTGDQVHAALGLLKKYRPDLKSVEFVGEVAHDHVHKIEVTIIDPPTPSGEGVSATAGAQPL